MIRGSGHRASRGFWRLPAAIVIGISVMAIAGSVPTTGATIDYGGPIVITRGGVYSGAWQSLDPDVAAVRIKTTRPVTIENCWLRGRGALIKGSGHAKVTVRNCHAYGLNPNLAGRVPGRFLGLEGFDNVVVDNNYIEGTSGISLRNYAGDHTADQTVKVRRNRVKNVDGRRSDGAGGYSRTGFAHVQFVRLSESRHMRGVELAWNEVINQPGKSRVEDNINIYLSSGTPESPILIHDNYIHGAYPAVPTSAGYSGGGILLGDGISSDAGGSSAFVNASRNQIIGTTGYGIAVAAGHDNRFTDNRLVASGRLADGSWIASQNVGAYIWNLYGRNGYSSQAFYNNYAQNNVIGWMQMKKDGSRQLVRNDTWFPNCATASDGKYRCVDNAALMPDLITRETEAAEYRRWSNKVSAAKVNLGASGM